MKRHIIYPYLFSLVLPGIMLVLAFIFMYVFPEDIYSRKVFPVVRNMLNLCFGSWSVPGFLIFIPIALIYVILIIYRGISRKSWRNGFVQLMSFTMVLLALFLWFWGVHYAQLSPAAHIDFRENKIVETDVLRTAGLALTTRREWLSDEDSISADWPNYLTILIQDQHPLWLEVGLSKIGFLEMPKTPKMKYWPRGFLLRWGVSGIYWPFTGEPGIDRGLHTLRMPLTALHEWTHSLGFTGEGDCNLVAYLAAMEAEEPMVRYSAYLERFQDELYLLAITDFNAYMKVKGEVPLPIQNDILSIKKHHARYKGVFAEVGSWVNDQYLKTMGMDDGIDNYWKWVLAIKELE
jgi:hypothetical protein